MIEILQTLGYAVLERDAAGLKFVSAQPAWYPHAAGELTEHFPFLETFLSEAEEFWQTGQEGSRSSGEWVESDPGGHESAFEAVAIHAAGRNYLLLRLLGQEYEERRQALQNARSQRLQQERLNRMKDEFLAAMSHELRTPLNAILGFSGLLLQEKAGGLNAKQKDFAGHVSKAANHLLCLINDVLDLAKLEAGRLRLELEACTLGDVVADVMETLRPVTAGRHLTMDSDGLDLLVYADPMRLKQILYNLLSNAIKFTGAGGRIHVSAAIEGAYVATSIADTGIGIRPQDQIAIFDRFHQVARSRGEGGEGTGLGLAIVRKLVEEQGGQIRLQSEPGKGSCFTFTLPGVVYHSDADSPAEAADTR